MEQVKVILNLKKLTPAAIHLLHTAGSTYVNSEPLTCALATSFDRSGHPVPATPEVVDKMLETGRQLTIDGKDIDGWLVCEGDMLVHNESRYAINNCDVFRSSKELHDLIEEKGVEFVGGPNCKAAPKEAQLWPGWSYAINNRGGDEWLSVKMGRSEVNVGMTTKHEEEPPL